MEENVPEETPVPRVPAAAGKRHLSRGLPEAGRTWFRGAHAAAGANRHGI